ncbi:hypothetical protein [Candidatus Tisiphia endosymbiont of Sialis lutaria]|uniref:hypothetical protein n=1 Tax=Candidatus Tisiphia endosymbiont of Sialis lutaria TaxID=2029164 RepID=UPI00312CA7BA
MGKKLDEVQESLSAKELKSNIGEMPGTFLALRQLEEVKKNLEEARKCFSGTASKAFSGVKKLEFEKAGKVFEEFMSSFEKLKEFADNVDHKKPLDKLSSSITLTGRLKDFATEQLKKVEKIFEAPINAIKDNKILNAVVNVIKCSCKAVSAIVKSSLNNAIAVGDVAKSVVNLGSAIKEAAMGKGTQASMSK